MNKVCNTDKIIENIKDLKKPSYSLYDGEYIKGENDDLGIENIVFTGGGAVGISYIGALKALREKNILNKIHYMAGSSSGAIIVTLVALGATNEFILNKLSTVNLSSLFTVVGHELNYKNCIGKFICAYYGLPELIMNLGLCSTEPFMEWFASCMEELGYNKNLTFAELYNITGIHLAITTSSLNTKTTLYLTRSSYPHMKIIDAINASILLPFIFQPVKMYDPHLGMDKPIYLTDGGILNNTPINICDVISDDGEIIGFNRKTIAFLPIDDGKFYPDYFEINNILDYSMALIKHMHNCIHLEQTHQAYFYPRVICIETANISATDFNISKETIQFLIESGYKATKIYLEKREEMIREKGPLPKNLFIPNLRLQCCGIEYISDKCIANTRIYQTNPTNFNLNTVEVAHLYK